MGLTEDKDYYGKKPRDECFKREFGETGYG
jgi:hypothetical protein